MRKRHWVMFAGLLAVILISNLEDYFSSTEFSTREQDYESIDYYLTDFSLQALNATGQISHTIDGQYLAYWQEKESSFIIRPRLVSKDNSASGRPVDAVVLDAEEALLDHDSEAAELTGQVNLVISHEGAEQFSLRTSQLYYNLKEKHISTEQTVRINGPQLQLSGTGMDSYLDESTLRLNANVKSVYQPD